MILPEERADFASMKQRYRDWLERTRRESDEQRAAQRSSRREREQAFADPGERGEPPGEGR